MVTSQARGAFLKGQDLLLQSGELQHSQRVVLRQEAPQCVPAAADAHHHMFPMKHLRGKANQLVNKKPRLVDQKSRVTMM